MLTLLSIRDIVLIEKLDVEFQDGLTVFTGETGAGKSIVLDSLGLALGGRGQASLVRKGQPFGSVTARFELAPDHAIHAQLRERGLDDDGEAVVLRRVQYADGRTKGFINDKPTSGAFLKQVGAALVEIHGQHDDRALMDASVHRALLDQFGGHDADCARVADAWQRWKDARDAEIKLRERADMLARDREFLEASFRELEALGPEPGEEEQLAARRKALQASARLRGDLEAAAEALSAPAFPAQKLNAVLRRLEKETDLPADVKAMTEALQRALIEAQEASALAGQALAKRDDGDVDRIEDRLFKLRGLARKHRVPADNLASVMEKMRADLEAIDTCDEALLAARRATVACAADYRKAAAVLGEKRQKAAVALDKAVMKELPPLKLDKARFITHIEGAGDGEDDTIGHEHGLERVVFQVATNPGSDPGPIMKVASGGELARFLLALKVVLASRHTAPVLVFDEIDTGVGGATASAIGERLARLGKKAQVIAVTHSPQVAAHADAHTRLYKAERGRGAEIAMHTSAEALDQPGRLEEIARMLAGKTVTDEARAAAAQLIGSKDHAR
jgi:DNA repair protein RecN (Recombination protein N)